MAGKPIDAAMMQRLLSGKRTLTGKPLKPDTTPARLDCEEHRPEWHKWVYGGQRNPTI